MLGPILFLIFINDIDLCITESIIRSFADDTRVSKLVIEAICCEKTFLSYRYEHPKTNDLLCNNSTNFVNNQDFDSIYLDYPVV